VNPDVSQRLGFDYFLGMKFWVKWLSNTRSQNQPKKKNEQKKGADLIIDWLGEKK
jgi:hypothetical protein